MRLHGWHLSYTWRVMRSSSGTWSLNFLLSVAAFQQFFFIFNYLVPCYVGYTLSRNGSYRGRKSLNLQGNILFLIYLSNLQGIVFVLNLNTQCCSDSINRSTPLILSSKTFDIGTKGTWLINISQLSICTCISRYLY